MGRTLPGGIVVRLRLSSVRTSPNESGLTVRTERFHQTEIEERFMYFQSKGLPFALVMCLGPVLLLSTNPCHAQQLDATSIITRWLLTVDSVGEEGLLEGRLAALGINAEASLIDAARNGPDSAMVANFNTLAGNEFDFLSTADTSDMTADEIQALSGISRNQFVADETDKYVLKFRSRAVLGLGVVATPGALQVIQALAQDDSSPLQEFAKLALNRIQASHDTIPPTTSSITSPLANLAGWNNSNVTVNLTSADNPGGSGVQQITYSIGGAQTVSSTTVNGASASFTISSEGMTTISFFATDHAANLEAANTLVIRLDKTPPTVTGSASPAADVNGWDNTNVTVSFQCADQLSGLAAGSLPAPTTLSNEGAGQSVTATCTDVAGNSASATVNGINIDKTPPVITASTNLATLWPPNGRMVSVTVSGTISDSLSGINPSTAAFAVQDSYGLLHPSGLVSVSANGTYSFTIPLEARRDGQDKNGRLYTIVVSARDNAGNASLATTTVIVPHDLGQ
jgi:hypothetical protein